MVSALLTLLLLPASLQAAPGRFVPARPGEEPIGSSWLVVIDAHARDEVEVDVERRVLVERRWRSALRGLLVRAPSPDAEALTALPGITGVFQNLAIPNAWSAPLPDCSEGLLVNGPAPTFASTQSITCTDPSAPTATCPDNWGLDRIDGVSDGQYAAPRTGQGVRLFVIDTGVMSQHTEFAGRLGTGFDATHTSGSTEDCSQWSHGTHVAAIAAGRRYGVAKGATVHPIRVAGCPVSLTLDALVSAFDWIAQVNATTLPGPAVATMSINSNVTAFRSPTEPLGLAIRAVLDAGVLVVESAGNQAADACAWTSEVPGVLVVGGSDELDTPWERVPGDANYASWCPPDCGSNTGSCVSVFAPAAHVVSAWGGLPAGPSNACQLSGTSMAAPFVAGAAALVLQATPTATPAQVRQTLEQRARPVMTQVPAQTTTRLLSVTEASARLALSSPSLVDFGTLELGASASHRVTVSSAGTAALTLSNVTLTGEGLRLVDGCARAPMPPGQACDVEVVAEPMVEGVRTGVLSFVSNDPGGPRQVSFLLAGVAPTLSLELEAPGVVVTSSPSGIDCGTTCSARFPPGTDVTLQASGEVEWSTAGCAGGSCVVRLTRSTVVQVRVGIPDAGLDAGVSAGGLDAGRETDGGRAPDAGRADAGVSDAGASSSRERPAPVVGSIGCRSAPPVIPALVLVLAMTAWRRRRR